MAYYEKIDVHGAELVGSDDVAFAVASPGFSPLEWTVIRLARKDSLATLRPAGRLRRFWNWLMAEQGDPGLVNPQLEALRRMAVLSWRYDFSVPAEEVARFLSAGFRPEHYELMARSIRAALGLTEKRIGA